MNNVGEFECPKHPQSSVWRHPEGDRCGICGYFLDGCAPAQPEKKIVRTFEHYNVLALRTDKRLPLEYYAGGLSEEAGEILKPVRKAHWNGHALDDAKRAKLLEEAGDALWNLNALVHHLGSSLAEVAAMNIEKLKIRYPTGYSDEASIKRVDVQITTNENPQWAHEDCLCGHKWIQHDTKEGRSSTCRHCACIKYTPPVKLT